MPYQVVEKTFTQPLTDEKIDHLFSDLSPCLDHYQARWVHSYLSNDRLRLICIFEAADAESVRMAHRTAGIRFERVWPSQLITQPTKGEPSGV